MPDENPEQLMALLLDSLLAEKEERPLPSAAARGNLLAALEGCARGTPFPGFLRRVAHFFRLSEPKAAAILAKMNEPESWLPLGTVSMYSFESAPAPSDGDLYTGLVRCAPGFAFPTHRHIGHEVSLFLSGTVRDDDTGTVFYPGDVIEKPAGSLHHLSVVGTEECVFAVRIEGGFPDFEI